MIDNARLWIHSISFINILLILEISQFINFRNITISFINILLILEISQLCI